VRYFVALFLILYLFVPSQISAEQSGTLANAKVATGTDSASTNCCDIERITFHVDITNTATVAINCSVKADGTLHATLVTVTVSSIFITSAPCTNIQSDVTLYTSGEVTVEYKVVQ